MKRKKHLIEFTVAAIGIFISLFIVVLFNQNLLMKFSLPVRALLMIISQWFLLVVPLALMIYNKERLKSLGFKKDRIFMQVLIGLAVAASMSVVLTVVPILIGLKDMVGSTSYTKPWQFAYQFVYSIIGVALAEEIIFRGYLFNKLLKIKDSRLFAIIISSILFGLFHVFNGNIIQIILTACIGLLFCFVREKIKDCTLLSLIIAHGVYDAMIVLLVAVL